MKAIGFFKSDPKTGGEVLRDIDVPKPSPTGRDPAHDGSLILQQTLIRCTLS